jgi:hypothetical protein
MLRPRTFIGVWHHRLSLALLIALVLPSFALPGAQAQDGTGGPTVSDEFYAPPACSSSGNNGLVVYQTLNFERTSPNRALVVANGSGERQRAIPLDGVPVRTIPTEYPGRLIVITSDDEGEVNRIEVVDALRGFRYPLDIPGDQIASLNYPTPATQASAGSRYIVLSDVPQRTAWLVDLNDGVATDLLAIARDRHEVESISLVSATVSYDDRHVLLVTDQSVLIIPTANPSGDRLVGDPIQLSGFHFLDDEGSPLVYLQALENGATGIMLFDTDRYLPRQIAEANDLISATPLPNGDALILATPGSLDLIELRYLATTHIADVEGNPGTVLMAPSGTRLTYEVTTPEGIAWRFVNLRNGETQELPDLNGVFPIAPAEGLRWFVFGTTAIVAQNQGGLTYMSLDLERGITTTLLTTVDGINYLPPTVTPGEGRFALIPSIVGTRQNYDVVDNRTGLTTPLLDSRAVSATLSPDGCWAAVARVMGVRSDRNFRIYLVPLDGRNEPIAGELGISPVWLRG